MVLMPAYEDYYALVKLVPMKKSLESTHDWIHSDLFVKNHPTMKVKSPPGKKSHLGNKSPLVKPGPGVRQVRLNPQTCLTLRPA